MGKTLQLFSFCHLLSSRREEHLNLYEDLKEDIEKAQADPF